MTPYDAASALDGCDYGKEGSRQLFHDMKIARLVAVFGASDDLMEFRGAIDDEVGAYNGTTIHVGPNGLPESKCDEGEACPYFVAATQSLPTIEAVWDEDIPWKYKTDIPNVPFDILKDGEIYCRGIVFSLDYLNPT